MKQLKEKYWGIGCLVTFSIFTGILLKQVEDIDITGTPSGSGDHMTEIVSSPFTVWNTDSINNPDASDGPGDTSLDSVELFCSNLTDGESHYIMHDNITFNPQIIEYIASGDSQEVIALVNIPGGTYAALYTGTITVGDDDGLPVDNVVLTITVNSSYDLDISDNEADLILNQMLLSGVQDTLISGTFKLVNPNSAGLNVDPDPFGNADLTALIYSSTALIYNSDTISADQVTFPSAPSSIGSGEILHVNTQVYIPDTQQSGAYTGTVTVADALAGVSDNFTLNVNVSEGVEESGGTDLFLSHIYLLQNTPNPVYSKTQIKYGLSQNTYAILNIYDIIGHKIQTLIEERQGPGVYEVIWDGRDGQGKKVAPGVYFYRFEAGDYKACRKAVLLR